MPKISEAGGPTDATQPDYFEAGKSHQSPNVTSTEEDNRYEDAMERHGTDAFTDEDRQVVEEYQAKRREQADGEVEQAEARRTGDYSGYSYAELQQLARDRNLSATGTQDALVKRLQESDRD